MVGARGVAPVVALSCQGVGFVLIECAVWSLEEVIEMRGCLTRQRVTIDGKCSPRVRGTPRLVKYVVDRTVVDLLDGVPLHRRVLG